MAPEDRKLMTKGDILEGEFALSPERRDEASQDRLHDGGWGTTE